MLDPTKNFAKATLSTTYGSTDTTITVNAGEGARFPDPYASGAYNVVWYDSTHYVSPIDDPLHEIVRVTLRSTDTFVVTRAQEDTIAVPHNIPGTTYKILLVPTKKLIDDINAMMLNALPLQDGSDGTVTISGTTTMTRDMFYSSLTISPGGVLDTGGFRVFSRNGIENNGQIYIPGGNGGNASTTTGGSAGSAAASGSLSGGSAGGAGANGKSVGVGNTGATAPGLSKALGGTGASGGAGGSGFSAGGGGGAGGVKSGTVYNVIKNVYAAYYLFDFMPSVALLTGGTGGGGGGSGGSDGSATSMGGGGGGGGGGILPIFTSTLINRGNIFAKGGAGGNGASIVSSNVGAGGGGGGGAGGSIILVYNKLINTGTISVNGGAGGSGGTNPGAGGAGVNGSTGGAGNIYHVIYGV